LPLYQLAIAFGLLFVRVLAVIIAAPVTGELGFPWRLRVLLSLFMAAAFFPFAAVETEWLKADVIVIALLAAREFIVGAGIGLVLGIVYSAFRLAGETVGHTMGIAIANVVDPLQDVEVSVIGEFWYFTALAVFLAADGHVYLVRAVQESAQIAPVGALSAFSVKGMLAVMVESTGVMFVFAARLLLPVVGVVFTALFGMGFLGRMIPQMHVFIVGFPLMLGIGLLGLYFALPASAYLVDELVGESARLWGGWLRACS